MKRTNPNLARMALISALVMLAVGGCSSQSKVSSSAQTAPAPQAATTPVPYVENCAEVSVGSPSKFACNGKTYTAFELAKIRETEAKKYASGK
jgi:hypothetical protein